MNEYEFSIFRINPAQISSFVVMIEFIEMTECNKSIMPWFKTGRFLSVSGSFFPLSVKVICYYNSTQNKIILKNTNLQKLYCFVMIQFHYKASTENQGTKQICFKTTNTKIKNKN